MLLRGVELRNFATDYVYLHEIGSICGNVVKGRDSPARFFDLQFFHNLLTGL